MGYFFFYVPKRFLLIGNLSFAIGVLSCLLYFVFIAMGFEFQTHRMLMGGTLALCIFALGCSFSIPAVAALYENTNRRRDGRLPYYALNRIGSWRETSFGFAQTLNTIGLMLGAVLLVVGCFAGFLSMVCDDFLGGPLQAGATRGRQCECMGAKVYLKHDAPADGRDLSICIGIIKDIQTIR